MLAPVSTKLTLTKGPASVSARCACMPMWTSCPVVSAWNTWDWLGARMRVNGSPAPKSRSFLRAALQSIQRRRTFRGKHARTGLLTLVRSWLIRQPCSDVHWLLPLQGQCKDRCKGLSAWETIVISLSLEGEEYVPRVASMV